MNVSFPGHCERGLEIEATYLCQVCNWIVCCGISTNNAVRKCRIAPGNIIFLFLGKRNANSTTGGIPLLINGIAWYCFYTSCATDVSMWKLKKVYETLPLFIHQWGLSFGLYLTQIVPTGLARVEQLVWYCVAIYLLIDLKGDEADTSSAFVLSSSTL